jgi:phosphoserine phosphatase
LEATLKDTKETFEMAKQNWAKEEAVLKQRLEFAQFQLDEEKKKFEENRVANESLLKSLQTQNRESVIGREEFQQRVNDIENKFVDERKALEKQHNESR